LQDGYFYLSLKVWGLKFCKHPKYAAYKMQKTDLE